MVKVGNIKLFLFLVVVPWTDNEKVQLLKALNNHGADNLHAVMDELPYKNLMEVKRIISYYQSLAQNKIQNQRNDLKMTASPIDVWIKVLKDLKGRHVTLDHVSRALKYIALYEKRVRSDVDMR